MKITPPEGSELPEDLEFERRQLNPSQEENKEETDMKLLKQILAAMTMILMFLAVPVSAEEAEGTAYAIFEESTGTLTFKRTAPGEAVPTAEAAGVDNVYRV